MSLNHPVITLAELQALNSANPDQSVKPADYIDFWAKPSSLPYRLVWVRHPSGDTRLYRLIPDAKPTTQESTP